MLYLAKTDRIVECDINKIEIVFKLVSRLGKVTTYISEVYRINNLSSFSDNPLVRHCLAINEDAVVLSEDYRRAISIDTDKLVNRYVAIEVDEGDITDVKSIHKDILSKLLKNGRK